MAEAGPRYSFAPLERRGVVLGLQGGQLAGLVAAMLAGVVVRAVLGGAPGTGAAAVVVLGGAASVLWTIEGRPAARLALERVWWVLRRAGRTRLSPAPLAGSTVARPGPEAAPSPGPAAAGAAPLRRRPSRVVQPGATRTGAGRPGPGALLAVAPGIELGCDRDRTGAAVGTVGDRRSGTLAAVIPVGGRSQNLLDPGAQASRLESWRGVLGALSRSGSPVVRLQWVQRRGLGGTAPSDLPSGYPVAVADYARLAAEAGPHVIGHDSVVVLVVDGRGPAGRASLGRELRLLEGQLRAAGLDPAPPLDPAGLAAMLSGHVGIGTGAPGPPPGPVAVAEDWGSVRVDDGWYCTWWVAEWPRIEVGPDFLAPVLIGRTPSRAAVVMAPVPADRALREVRSARTADLADAELRERAGFLSSARREREAEGVSRREAELADGHSEYRFSGYLTVRAGDPEELSAACAEMEQAAQSARLTLRRMWGRQAEAYGWTLPLGRGLR